MSMIEDDEAATVPLRQPLVVQAAMDVKKGTTLKWEPVCVPLMEGLVPWGGQCRVGCGVARREWGHHGLNNEYYEYGINCPPSVEI